MWFPFQWTFVFVGDSKGDNYPRWAVGVGRRIWVLNFGARVSGSRTAFIVLSLFQAQVCSIS